MENPVKMKMGTVNAMSDEFRRGLDRAAGKGGVKCSCCGDPPGKARDILRRLVKHRLKQDLLKAVEEAEAEEVMESVERHGLTV